MTEFQEVIKEIFQFMDEKSAQVFLDIFQRKLEELKNDQQTNLQENTGTPR